MSAVAREGSFISSGAPDNALRHGARGAEGVFHSSEFKTNVNSTEQLPNIRLAPERYINSRYLGPASFPCDSCRWAPIFGRRRNTGKCSSSRSTSNLRGTQLRTRRRERDRKNARAGKNGHGILREILLL